MTRVRNPYPLSPTGLDGWEVACTALTSAVGPQLKNCWDFEKENVQYRAVREPNNKFDAHAVKFVRDAGGRQDDRGYLRGLFARGAFDIGLELDSLTLAFKGDDSLRVGLGYRLVVVPLIRVPGQKGPYFVRISLLRRIDGSLQEPPGAPLARATEEAISQFFHLMDEDTAATDAIKQALPFRRSPPVQREGNVVRVPHLAGGGWNALAALPRDYQWGVVRLLWCALPRPACPQAVCSCAYPLSRL